MGGLDGRTQKSLLTPAKENNMRNLVWTVLLVLACTTAFAQRNHKKHGRASSLISTLAADYELTLGPQDAHTGHYDLSDGGSGDWAYGPEGAQSVTGLTDLIGPSVPAFSFSSADDWFISYRCKLVSPSAAVFVSDYRDDINDPAAALIVGGATDILSDNRTWASVFSDLDWHSTAPPGFDANTSQNSSHVVFGWFDHAAQTITVQVDDQAPVSQDVNVDLDPGWTITAVATHPRIFLSIDGTAIRYLRYWIGAGAIRSPSERLWLYNGGNGRTYSELMNY